MSKKARRSGRGSKKLRRILICAAAITVALLAVIWVAVYFFRLPQRVVYPLKYRDEIIASSEQYGLDPCLVAAVISTESGFDPEAVSSAGAVGLMQLLPETAEWVAGMRGMTFNEALLTEPQYNIDLGCWLLKYLLQTKNYSVRTALAAYNAGIGTVEKWRADENYVDDKGELAVIPYDETRNYVERIEQRTAIYRNTYGEDLNGDFD